MTIPAFTIDEWLVCRKCGVTCDAPFLPVGCDAVEPELVLGTSLPESVVVPLGEWQTEVVAVCPACGHHLRARAVFHSRTLYAFTEIDAA
jgi:hypothetical protein